jgi:hypothetical protein
MICERGPRQPNPHGLPKRIEQCLSGVSLVIRTRRKLELVYTLRKPTNINAHGERKNKLTGGSLGGLVSIFALRRMNDPA